MKELADEAVVLRTYKSGEADRIAVLWTRGHGKVRILAKGVRKTTSRMGGALEPMGYVKVDLVKSRGDLYVTRHVAHLEQWNVLRGQYERIAAGLSVVEAVDAVPAEDVADEGLFELVVRGLRSLDNPAFYPDLVPASFFLKLLVYDGSEPVVDECVNCGSPGPLVAFHAASGGTLCVLCRTGTVISADVLTLLRRVLGGDLAAVLKEAPGPGAGELMALAQEAIEEHFGRRLKAPRASAPLAPLTTPVDQ